MFKQMSSFFDDVFSKYQYGFIKGFSTQQCLLALLEKWKRSIDRGKVFGALLTDLSKVFDCLNHDLLIAKLNGYGFSLPALRLIHEDLLNRKQRTRINNSIHTVHGWKLFLGYLKDQYLVPVCSTFSLQICSSLQIAWIFQTMLITVRHMLLPMI